MSLIEVHDGWSERTALAFLERLGPSAEYAKPIVNNKQVERSIPNSENRTQARQTNQQQGKDMKQLFTGLSLMGLALLANWRCPVKVFNQELERGGTQMRRFGGTL